VTRVLVIDDEGSILRALRINLTARKYDVLTAADGASGLAAMARARPDVLILDLGLPDMDGADVIKGVRGQASTPIIVLSAAGQESTKVAALDAGADDYLTKPFGIDALPNITWQRGTLPIGHRPSELLTFAAIRSAGRWFARCRRSGLPGAGGSTQWWMLSWASLQCSGVILLGWSRR